MRQYLQVSILLFNSCRESVVQPPESTLHLNLTLTTTATAPQFAQPRPTTIPPAAYTPQPISGSQPRGERNLQDANEAKASRKLDIERRCQQLDPPILPNVLRHMDSFKAAIHIPQPMNDYSWNVLLPRLLAQLPAAEQAESEHVSRVTSLTTRAADRRQQDASLKEVKEVLDREWEESQRPVRDRLNAIADDFINQDWDRGRAVTYENSPKFAVDLLMHVRRKFYEEATDDAASQKQEDGDAPEGAEPGSPKLVLENMKWVYDNKLKPLTEQFRKELFLCYGAGCEGNTRFYGFEGVIQHFGAKHTNTFSVGNVVVAWREAEWPEDTPFHPDPISVKHAYHQASAGPSHGHSGYGSYYGGFSRAGTSTPHMQPHLPQTSPGPYSYGGHYNGPFAPPLASSHATSGFDYPQAYGVSTESYSSYLPMGPPGYGNQAGNYSYVTSPAISNAAVAPPPVVQPQAPGANEPPSQNNAGEGEYRTDLYDKQVSTIIEMTQDLWKQTSGIKDFPNSLRIYVLLHRVISKFHMEFNHEPNLNHFIDALSNHEIPRALKNAPGLSCKACQDASAHPSVAFTARPEERRVYTVLNLFLHFQSQHSGPQAPGFTDGRPPAYLDWKEDMIELPSDRFISGLIHAPGMDDDKLHMIATVFPRQFPTPLPRIGVVEHNGVASPVPSVSKESKDVARTGGTPAVSTEKSGPSSLASPYTDSPKPPKPSEDEYDPQRPALPAQATQSSRPTVRKRAFQGSPPPTDRRPRYYAEPRYYVGSMKELQGDMIGANTSLVQLSRESLDDDYARHREYVGLGPSPRIIRDSGPAYEDYPGRRPLYRDPEAFYAADHENLVFAHPREGIHPHEYEMYSHQVRYVQDDGRRPEYRRMREPRSREHTPSRAQIEADRFLEEFVPGQSAADEASEPGPGPQPTAKRSAAETEPEDGSRYTPPPPSIPQADDQLESQHALTSHHTAPSTISNGSRYEDYRSGGRNVPTPDSGGGPRRAGAHRRRDRHHDYVPSRYYRYMSVTRDDPYHRGSSMSRSQSKRYERYEDARRQINQQETPQPGTEREYDPVYSRDQSVDQSYPEESYQNPIRAGPREYVPLQDRHPPYSPPRYRFAGPPDDPRGPAPMYVDEYGQPIHEYEIIRVPRDHRVARTPYAPTRYYPEHESDHVQYVPISRERPQPRGYNGRPSEYVYYEERERVPSMRRAALDPESEASYEPPPEIKVEGAPVPVPVPVPAPAPAPAPAPEGP